MYKSPKTFRFIASRPNIAPMCGNNIIEGIMSCNSKKERDYQLKGLEAAGYNSIACVEIKFPAHDWTGVIELA